MAAIKQIRRRREKLAQHALCSAAQKPRQRLAVDQLERLQSGGVSSAASENLVADRAAQAPAERARCKSTLARSRRDASFLGHQNAPFTGDGTERVHELLG